MPHCKITKIFSEINDFFTSSEKAIKKTMELYKVIRIPSKDLEVDNKWPKEYNVNDLLLMLLLMPLFSIKNINQYLTSSLSHYIEAGKDTLYRLKNNQNINWRKITSEINKRIRQRIEQEGTVDSDSPKCLIIDDSDLPKRGKFIEHISRIWSHVNNRCIMGFKGLFLLYWDSKSYIGLDFSLHKERGKNEKYPFGLKPGIYKKQYKKKRTKESHGQKRVEELEKNKIDNAIIMIKRALRNKLSVEYVLMDSWFVCDKIIKEILQIGAHVIGMSKFGRAKYKYRDKNRSAKQIVDHLRKGKNIRWIKNLKLYVAEAMVEYKGVPLKLFFCRNTKRGKWHLLVTTQTKLSIKEAYRIYSIRWGIEVFFKEAKQYFGLGKSQSRDFDAQIADTTISMMQYNIFSLAKRFGSYETLGELFREAKESVVELTVCKRIWGFFLELISIIAEFFEIEPDELIEKIITSNDSENKLIRMMQSPILNAA